MQLSKYIAHAGICSRRKSEELIRSGAVMVNGAVVTEWARRVQPTDEVVCRGNSVKPEEFVYVVLNKPTGVVTTVSDEQGRKTVLDLIELDKRVRLYPVGRLDCMSSGVLLLTNDGDLAQRLAHPSNQIEKRYHVILTRPLSRAHIQQLHQGVKITEGVVKADELMQVPGRSAECIISLHSGQNRVVRRMFHKLGYVVRRLDRVFYAGITQKGLARGEWRLLSKDEIEQLSLPTQKTVSRVEAV